MENKTIKEWLSLIADDDIRHKALYNLELSSVNSKETRPCFKDAIGSAFIWKEALEGYDFWSKVQNDNNIKLLDEPDINKSTRKYKVGDVVNIIADKIESVCSDKNSLQTGASITSSFLSNCIITETYKTEKYICYRVSINSRDYNNWILESALELVSEAADKIKVGDLIVSLHEGQTRVKGNFYICKKLGMYDTIYYDDFGHNVNESNFRKATAEEAVLYDKGYKNINEKYPMLVKAVDEPKQGFKVVDKIIKKEPEFSKKWPNQGVNSDYGKIERLSGDEVCVIWAEDKDGYAKLWYDKSLLLPYTGPNQEVFKIGDWVTVKQQFVGDADNYGNSTNSPYKVGFTFQVLHLSDPPRHVNWDRWVGNSTNFSDPVIANTLLRHATKEEIESIIGKKDESKIDNRAFKPGDKVINTITKEKYVVKYVPGMREYDYKAYSSTKNGVIIENSKETERWIFADHIELDTSIQEETALYEVGTKFLKSASGTIYEILSITGNSVQIIWGATNSELVSKYLVDSRFKCGAWTKDIEVNYPESYITQDSNKRYMISEVAPIPDDTWNITSSFTDKWKRDILASGYSMAVDPSHYFSKMQEREDKAMGKYLNTILEPDYSFLTKEVEPEITLIKLQNPITINSNINTNQNQIELL